MGAGRTLTRAQKIVLTAAFVPMLATGAAGGAGTFSNIKGAYGSGTALGAVAAGEGATAVLALVLLGLTMLGQASPPVVRIGLWLLPTAAAAMAAMAAEGAGRTVIYAVTPMGMCVAAEGMAFLARRIVVHTDGRDAEAEHKAATVVRSLAYHRARAANHPDKWTRKRSERTSWRLARRVGTGDASLGSRLLDVQRERVTEGADAALADMFGTAVTAERHAVTAPVRPALPPAPEPQSNPEPAAVDTEAVTVSRDTEDTQVSLALPNAEEEAVTPVTLDEVAAVTGVPTPHPAEALSDEQLVVVLRHLRYSADPPLSYRQAVMAFREAGFVGGEQRVRKAWGALMSQEESTP
ncbi:hypothetical protein [Streptomyces sp. NBC_01565]|uniref:hypothetical protein n=1 Tax=unclassified Streptomyces TaxID=2593676 RepID=UPI00224DA8C9|nr:hypothetical protein [Streptomyces sp. NBC_01565]MCX4541906.1 hypothetical protein [Streptomyces sp. NBC_01565]